MMAAVAIYALLAAALGLAAYAAQDEWDDPVTLGDARRIGLSWPLILASLIMLAVRGR